MKVKINRNITAGGVNHKKGSTIELDEKDAKALIARKFAEEVKTKGKANKA
jgi:hypothetical protein